MHSGDDVDYGETGEMCLLLFALGKFFLERRFEDGLLPKTWAWDDWGKENSRVILDPGIQETLPWYHRIRGPRFVLIEHKSSKTNPHGPFITILDFGRCYPSFRLSNVSHIAASLNEGNPSFPLTFGQDYAPIIDGDGQYPRWKDVYPNDAEVVEQEHLMIGLERPSSASYHVSWSSPTIICHEVFPNGCLWTTLPYSVMSQRVEVRGDISCVSLREEDVIIQLDVCDADTIMDDIID